MLCFIYNDYNFVYVPFHHHLVKGVTVINHMYSDIIKKHILEPDLSPMALLSICFPIRDDLAWELKSELQEYVAD